MNIAEKHVVSIHYTLTGDDGQVIDKSTDSPLTYLHGVGQIIPGLEKALLGKKAGDKLQVKIDPDHGYGQVDKSLLTQVEKEQLAAVPNLQVGMQLQGESPQGSMVFTVIEIKDDHVILDGNHPLAGVNLNFDVEVTGVRAASEEELSQGKPCATGCCD